jgi:uncharacterized protein (TIGR03067 family)
MPRTPGRLFSFGPPLLALAVCACAAPAGRAEDWPQWLGPRRDGVWRETGLVEKFPPGGPKVLWRVPLAAGYSGPAVADGRVYVMDRRRATGPDDAQALFRTVKGNAYTVARFKRVLGKGTIKLDAAKKPKAIDAYPAGRDKPLLGIYEFDGDKLKLCFAAPGKERPAAFTSAEGSGHTLTVWVREKE